MSADSGPSSAAAPNLNLAPEEKRLYGQLFRQADTDGVGVVTGEVAVTFFEKTRLDSATLGEIWQIADKENRGVLTPAGFGVVLRLIGHAQNGRKPTVELALQRAPLPRFDGITPAQVSSPGPIQAQATGGPIRIPPLTQDKVTQYAGLFERQPLQNTLLPGDQARQIFDKSGLPNETLGRIWSLADTEERGALTQTEFIISMHLLTSMKAGVLRGLPNVLPSGLYEAAAGRAPQSPRSAIPPLPRQLSGTPQNRTGSPLGRGGPNAWAVTPADKVKFDQLYADLDKANKGYITGEEAVPFFSRSGLPEDSLAQVWDLADVDSTGQLSKDEFAVAMYLIRQQRGGTSGPLPSTLPANLIPPSMRTQQQRQPAAAVFAPPPMTVPPPQPKSALDDLFGLESSSSSPAPPAPAQTTMSTGGSAGDPFAGGTPTSPVRSATTGSSFKPFIPTSSFGRGLATGPESATGGSTQQSGSDDLLADHDPEASKKITGESTELANLSNQIGSLSKEMQNVQAKRTTTQTELNQASSQKQNFEQRLAQLRQLYEKEAKNTRNLEEQLKKSRNETQKLQGECMTLEGTVGDLRQQTQQLSTALQSDQQENTSLRERIRVANAEIAQLKPQIEKLKSDGRQQKGLVAINKKQLLTTEGERDKLKTEAEGLQSGAAAEDLSRDATSPVSTPNRMASPALSTASGNNPFFKRTQSTDIMGVFAAPQSKNASNQSVDDVFGSSGSQPVPAPFKPQTTGASTASTGSYNTPGSTPTVSRQATLRADQPPPPPESRQISSSFLPFPEPAASITSSRQVSPPGSRAGGSVGDSATEPTETAQKGAPGSLAPSAVNIGALGAAGAGGAAALVGTANANDSTTSIENAVSPFKKDDLAQAKSDFDTAFADFSKSRQGSETSATGSKPKSAFDSEFPPINEFDNDDESDSETDENGFDDDFAAGAQQDKGKETAEKEPEQTGEVAEPETPAAVEKESGEATKEPEDASSPATVTNKQADAETAETADDIFGAAAASKDANKGGFDDLDDDFEGLEDAKEGSADEDFANISRSGLDDYNNVFDSSPPASQTKSDGTTFGNESSFDFVNPSAGTEQPKASESHDWDAIFAGLDSSDPVPSQGATADAAKPGTEESRPSGPGRALTDKGEHDDPILKNLTGMGYARADALSALEKYDYDLERAANHLANQS